MRRTNINHRADWPTCRWSDATLAGNLAALRHRQGQRLERIAALGFPLQRETMLASLTG
jgi:hypothetical protein